MNKKCYELVGKFLDEMKPKEVLNVSNIKKGIEPEFFTDILVFDCILNIDVLSNLNDKSEKNIDEVCKLLGESLLQQIHDKI